MLSMPCASSNTGTGAALYSQARSSTSESGGSVKNSKSRGRVEEVAIVEVKVEGIRVLGELSHAAS